MCDAISDIQECKEIIQAMYLQNDNIQKQNTEFLREIKLLKRWLVSIFAVMNVIILLQNYFIKT